MGSIYKNNRIIIDIKFNLSKYFQILKDSLELMLGGRSSSDDESMIACMVSNLVEVREENGPKRCSKVKIGKVNVNFSEKLV
jgi:hypothetical protein